MIRHLKTYVGTAAVLWAIVHETTRHQVQQPIILDITSTSAGKTRPTLEGEEMGIDKTLEVIEDITHLLISAIKLYKNGVGLHTFSQMWGIIDSIKELVLDLPPAMPELMDLDKDECSKLGAATHRMLSEIAQAFEK